VLLVYAYYPQRHMHTDNALWKPPVLVSITSFSVPKYLNSGELFTSTFADQNIRELVNVSDVCCSMFET